MCDSYRIKVKEVIVAAANGEVINGRGGRSLTTLTKGRLNWNCQGYPDFPSLQKFLHQCHAGLRRSLIGKICST